MEADLSSLIFSAAIGLVGGFLISIPVGPINITIINEGAHRGFRWAFLIGVGAIGMDLIYCSVAFAGFSGLFGSPLMRASIELLSFLAMLYLGVKYLMTPDLPETTKSVEAVEHRLHPHAAFAIGFVRVLGNPAVLLFWITLSASLISHRWIEDTWPSKAACVIGMATGAFVWFTFLSFVVSLGHGRFSKRTLVRMAHFSGAAFVVMGIIIGIRLIGMLAKLD